MLLVKKSTIKLCQVNLKNLFLEQMNMNIFKTYFFRNMQKLGALYNVKLD